MTKHPCLPSRNSDYGFYGTITATPLRDRTSDAFWTLAATRIAAAAGCRTEIEMEGVRDFLDQSALEQALADIADSAALEAGGDGEHGPVLARAGGRQDDGLGVGQLDLGHGSSPVSARATCGGFYEAKPAIRRAAPDGRGVTRRIRLP